LWGMGRYAIVKGSLVVASTKSSAVLVRAFESIVRRRAQESMVLLADVKTSRVPFVGDGTGCMMARPGWN